MQNAVWRQGSAHPADPVPGTVQFIDSNGVGWQVTERERMQYDRRWIRMLVFASPAAVRCVRSYPDDWRSLPAEDLEALSWRS